MGQKGIGMTKLHTAVAFGAIIITSFITGCVTDDDYPRAYTCDWCSNAFWVSSSGFKYEDGERKVVRKSVIRDTTGNVFCSLKCQNAYLASKDIKEERSRLIQGE